MADNVTELSTHPKYQHAEWDDLDRFAHALDVVSAYLDPDAAQP